MENKFKIGDIVTINVPGNIYGSEHNGKKAKVLFIISGYVALKQDYVPGDWCVPEHWLKLSNSHIIRKRLGIK